MSVVNRQKNFLLDHSREAKFDTPKCPSQEYYFISKKPMTQEETLTFSLTAWKNLERGLSRKGVSDQS